MNKFNRFNCFLIICALSLALFIYCNGSGTTSTGGDDDGDTTGTTLEDTTGDTTGGDTTGTDTTGTDTTGSDTTGDTTGTVIEDPTDAILADHTVVDSFDDISLSDVEYISENFSFYYGHTSHGSQIITGLNMIQSEDANYVKPYFYERSDDLGTLGDTSWVVNLRYRLDQGEYNIAMMSWCGGVSTNNETGMNTYLNKMNELESDYPDIIFIYMTGHLDGTGDAGNLRAMNNLIRSYCETNDKILFDFADIESYDPDGTFYPDGSDACEWCTTWCATHDCPSCGSCAHSHCFNCYIKGKAFWWLMSQLVQ